MRRKEMDLTVTPREAVRVWDADGIPILRGSASLPETPGKDRRCRRVRSFYALQERMFFRYCERDLRPWAETEYREARRNSGPLTCLEASLEFRETYRAGRLWSLYTELRENAAPGPPSRRRWGDTWDLATGYPVALSDFFRGRPRWKRDFLLLAAAEIERQEKRGLSRYYPDWRQRLRRAFHTRNYYLTPDGIAFFFPMYALAPALEGVPTFTLPWDGDAPLSQKRIPP